MISPRSHRPQFPRALLRFNEPLSARLQLRLHLLTEVVPAPRLCRPPLFYTRMRRLQPVHFSRERVRLRTPARAVLKGLGVCFRLGGVFSHRNVMAVEALGRKLRLLE